MNNPYKTREGGATVTIFAPYDCGNHCPFCINKGEYADTTGFDYKKIIESIRIMDSITPNCDFVFTGGEPFSKRDILQKMLDEIPSTHRVFINSTLPLFDGQTEQDIIDFTEKNKDKITCINVSRHLVKYVEESPDELLSKLAVPTRVNCVLYKKYPAERLPKYLERWIPYNIPVQFRFDYTATTPENLYDVA
ncbi:MAG: 4Fe-4S cluster-binding domain-containing protein, partial [Emergencia sp.]|nr:4Fe-4S cluster-binding domain-containing protein [Emergencia sp.]